MPTEDDSHNAIKEQIRQRTSVNSLSHTAALGAAEFSRHKKIMNCSRKTPQKLKKPVPAGDKEIHKPTMKHFTRGPALGQWWDSRYLNSGSQHLFSHEKHHLKTFFWDQMLMF